MNQRRMNQPSMWDQTETLIQKHEQGRGNWLRLAEDGAQEVVVFLGEPYPREVCFVDGKYEVFTKSHQAQGLKPTLRITFNVALLETKELKILEQGVMFLKDLIEVRKKYGLESWAFEIKRHGTGKDTRYSILPERQLSAEEQQAFASMTIKDLAAFYEGKTSNPEAEPNLDPTALIDAQTAEHLTERLKSLPRQAVTEFCASLGVTRVKALKAAQVPKAQSLLTSLESRLGAPAAEEVDPFA